tara:strand:+ start:496 stop:711 length:216 start_codon:yes stop_codon:yes gene_type:complete
MLSVFPAGVVNYCLIEMMGTQDPFPDCGKVFIRCQQEMQKRSAVVDQSDATKPKRSTITKVAKAFGISLED